MTMALYRGNGDSSTPGLRTSRNDKGPGRTVVRPGPVSFVELRPSNDYTPLPDHFSRSRRAVSGLKTRIAR